MHARSALMTVAPEQYGDLVAMLKDDVGPQYAAAEGFCAFTAVADPSQGQVFGVSFWKTAEDLARADELGRLARSRINEIAGTDNERFQTWDVLYYHLRPRPSKCARSLRVKLDE